VRRRRLRLATRARRGRIVCLPALFFRGAERVRALGLWCHAHRQIAAMPPASDAPVTFSGAKTGALISRPAVLFLNECVRVIF
jgi:hypothetical protein